MKKELYVLGTSDGRYALAYADIDLLEQDEINEYDFTQYQGCDWGGGTDLKHMGEYHDLRYYDFDKPFILPKPLRFYGRDYDWGHEFPWETIIVKVFKKGDTIKLDKRWYVEKEPIKAPIVAPNVFTIKVNGKEIECRYYEPAVSLTGDWVVNCKLGKGEYKQIRIFEKEQTYTLEDIKKFVENDFADTKEKDK